MADILLFGATGYTGRLTAAALAERGASFALAGRSRDKLDALAASTGHPDVHLAEVGDVEALCKALVGSRVLISCVGPFVELGNTAVEAALRSGVHYIDSTGEGDFIGRLIAEKDAEARSAGIAMAPALGFDETPGDVACTLAAEGMDRPEVIATYALPRTASAGTVRSSLGIMGSKGRWIENGAPIDIGAGHEMRWSPLPAPLGPRRAQAFPLALARLAPLHIDAQTFKTFVTTGGIEGQLLRFGAPLLGLLSRGPARGLLDRFVRLLPEGPTEAQREGGRWTILVEARSGEAWRNVVATGTDVYGITARTLSRAAVEMADDTYDRKGVLSPVQAVGIDALRDELGSCGVAFEIHEPGG